MEIRGGGAGWVAGGSPGGSPGGPLSGSLGGSAGQVAGDPPRNKQTDRRTNKQTDRQTDTHPRPKLIPQRTQGSKYAARVAPHSDIIVHIYLNIICFMCCGTQLYMFDPDYGSSAESPKQIKCKARQKMDATQMISFWRWLIFCMQFSNEFPMVPAQPKAA